MSRAFLLQPLPFVATAGPTGTFLPARGAANVATDYMGLVAAAAAGNQIDIVLDLGASRSVDTIALLGCNALPAAGVAMLSVNGDGNFAAAEQRLGGLSIATSDRPAAGGLYHPLWLTARPVASRWWRVRLPAVPGHALQLARIAVGQRFQPSRNFAWGMARGVRDLGGIDIGRLGALSRLPGKKLRTVDLSFPLTPKEETEERLLPLLESVGSSDSLLLCVDPDAHPERHRRLYYGALSGNPSAVWRSAAGFETRLQLESLI